jgi:hypothetical protein
MRRGAGYHANGSNLSQNVGRQKPCIKQNYPVTVCPSLARSPLLIKFLSTADGNIVPTIRQEGSIDLCD